MGNGYIFYIDVFVLKNFIMDMLALIGVKILLRRDVRSIRLAAAAFIFSILSAILIVVCTDEMVYTLLMHFVVNTAMTVIAFKEKRAAERLENWAATYMAVIVLGGIYDWIREADNVISDSAAAVAVTAVLGYIIVRYLIRRRARGNNIYPILLQNGECAVKVNGIYDSGNQLIDPYTGAGVSIVNREVAERLFKDAPPVRFVPYRSLGDDSGMLPVATIDELTITFGTSNITIHNVSIGIAEHELFTNVEYEIILHASYI